jgi:hypothetical protein
MVVFDTTRSIKKRNGPGDSLFIKNCKRINRLVKLGTIKLPELCPSFRAMPEPTSQLGAGRDLFQPKNTLQFLLFHTSRLYPINHDAFPVAGLRKVINTFDKHFAFGQLFRTSYKIF